ncbi:fungal-specific transcription factor domain-containing protein [Stachybotrys elegans]|uniref:Fungal-specific transcription factor domain-containing protein n=1 Tax=Stachybotrys elegans TaxID=80388 RepID=A0A8K0SU03_9HYPO|nr:fungal-specific transcription factor domain-containing protein [Stachybotrys elegans]
MSASRTKSGCWTCRIRRKNCASRALHCHGYGERPAWMSGEHGRQQILDSEQARDVRNGAERAYRRRRQNGSAVAPWSPYVLVQDLSRPSPDTHPRSPELDRTWSSCTQILRDCDYTPDYQYVHTFLDLIFPVQWGFFDLHQRQSDRQWLFDTIIASEPIYHASLGMCLSFESGLKAGSTSGQCNITPEVRASKLSALRGLQQYVAQLQQEPCLDISFLPQAVRSVAVILLLASLEIFTDVEGSWEVHQNAAGTVLDLIETKMTVPGSTSTLGVGFVGHLLQTLAPSFETRALEFFVTSFVWGDILAEATHGITYGKPRQFDYLPLLRQDIINMRTIMGCRNSIMIAIKEGQWEAEQMDKAKILNQRIRDLVQETTHVITSEPANPEAGSHWVTAIHAHACLVFLQTILMLHVGRSLLDMKGAVEECLVLLEALPSHLFIRVCWPYALVGCMASESQHGRFRVVLRRAEEAGHVLGFTWKGLIIMEACWKLRHEMPGSVWCLQTTMKHMEMRVLLI